SKFKLSAIDLSNALSTACPAEVIKISSIAIGAGRLGYVLIFPLEGFTISKVSRKQAKHMPMKVGINCFNSKSPHYWLYRNTKKDKALTLSFTILLNYLKCHYCFNFGSKASRRPSPNRLNPKTNRKIATPGKATTQGAFW